MTRRKPGETSVRSVAGRLQDEARDLGRAEIAAMALRLLAEPGERGLASFGVVRFGPFTFDAEAGLLHRDGAPIDLSIPERAVLHHLIVHRHRFSTVPELVLVAWPSGRGHASNLRSTIGTLRRRLQDPAPGAIIVSQRGSGYRFVADIETLDEPR